MSAKTKSGSSRGSSGRGGGDGGGGAATSTAQAVSGSRKSASHKGGSVPTASAGGGGSSEKKKKANDKKSSSDPNDDNDEEKEEGGDEGSNASDNGEQQDDQEEQEEGDEEESESGGLQEVLVSAAKNKKPYILNKKHMTPAEVVAYLRTKRINARDKITTRTHHCIIPDGGDIPHPPIKTSNRKIQCEHFREFLKRLREALPDSVDEPASASDGDKEDEDDSAVVAVSKRKPAPLPKSAGKKSKKPVATKSKKKTKEEKKDEEEEDGAENTDGEGKEEQRSGDEEEEEREEESSDKAALKKSKGKGKEKPSAAGTLKVVYVPPDTKKNLYAVGGMDTVEKRRKKFKLNHSQVVRLLTETKQFDVRVTPAKDIAYILLPETVTKVTEAKKLPSDSEVGSLQQILEQAYPKFFVAKNWPAIVKTAAAKKPQQQANEENEEEEEEEKPKEKKVQKRGKKKPNAGSDTEETATSSKVATSAATVIGLKKGEKTQQTTIVAPSGLLWLGDSSFVVAQDSPLSELFETHKKFVTTVSGGLKKATLLPIATDEPDRHLGAVIRDNSEAAVANKKQKADPEFVVTSFFDAKTGVLRRVVLEPKPPV